MDEANALHALKRGDEAALGWFIDRYAAYVSTIIGNIIGAVMSPSDVEEVAADVFFTLWTNAGKIQPGKEKAYLSAVARNKAKEKTRQIGQDIPLEDDILLLSTEGPERDFEAREQAAFVQQAILAMGDPDREIFLRHYYYYQPVAAIAEETGLNLSTVKTRLRRGRGKLKEQLRKGGYVIEDSDL